ncbi:MAG TPA: hypothetical protein VGL70_08010 [Candidatus Binatia bacterium]
MKRWLVVFAAALLFLMPFQLSSEDKKKYPAPRFPSYLKAPKNVEEVMPYARAAVRQVGGRTPLGLAEKGQTALLLAADHLGEPIIMEAIKRAFAERGIQAQVMFESELAGVSRDEARAIHGAKGRMPITKEYGFGYFEAGQAGEWGINWFKKHHPEVAAKLFPDLPKELAEKAEKLGGNRLGSAVAAYIEKHPEIDVVFYGRGGRQNHARRLGKYRDKFRGNFIFDNRYELMTRAPQFPGDIWRLAEERVIEPIAWLDRIHVTDPEGTNITLDLDEKMADAWGKSAYQQGHLYMLPGSATGRHPFSIVDYPALTKQYIPHFLSKVNGVIAGTTNHHGFYPRIEVHIKDGYVREVKGGGYFGDIWREAMKIPGIHEAVWPFRSEPGYWWAREAGLGTNPKFYQEPQENAVIGRNRSERNVAGVIHFGFGQQVVESPEGPTKPKEAIDFEQKTGLPNEHGWHIHNTMITYRARVRGTKNTWLTLIDRGRITALDSPEITALASRYGDPNEVLSQDWVRHLPGINAPGNYQEYAKNPWKFQTQINKKIAGGTYEYFYPVGKKASKSFQPSQIGGRSLPDEVRE